MERSEYDFQLTVISESRKSRQTLWLEKKSRPISPINSTASPFAKKSKAQASMPCTKQAHCIKDSDVENISIGDATGGFKLSDTKRCFRSYPMIKKIQVCKAPVSTAQKASLPSKDALITTRLSSSKYVAKISLA